MKTASMGEMKLHFSAFVKACESGPVIVTRNGKPVAVLAGINDEDEIERLLMANSPRLQAILDQSRQSIREGRGIPRDEFWKQFGLDPDSKPRRNVKRKRQTKK